MILISSEAISQSKGESRTSQPNCALRSPQVILALPQPDFYKPWQVSFPCSSSGSSSVQEPRNCGHCCTTQDRTRQEKRVEKKERKGKGWEQRKGKEKQGKTQHWQCYSECLNALNYGTLWHWLYMVVLIMLVFFCCCIVNILRH